MKKAGLPTTGFLTATLVFAGAHCALAQSPDDHALAFNNASINNNGTKIAASTIPVDARALKYDVRVSEAFAAKSSIGTIIVLYSGTNESLKEKVRQGAANAKAGGAPVRGMVIGKADPDFEGGKDSYVVYANGIAVTHRIDASDEPEAIVQQAIEEAKADYFAKTITPISKDNDVALANN